MTELEKQIASAEGLAIIDMMDQSEREKIPQEFIDKLKSNTSKYVKVSLKKEFPLEIQGISQGGLEIMKIILEYLNK